MERKRSADGYLVRNDRSKAEIYAADHPRPADFYEDGESERGLLLEGEPEVYIALDDNDYILDQ